MDMTDEEEDKFCSTLLPDTELPTKIANHLMQEGVLSVGDLIEKTETELLRGPNIGRKSMNEIKAVIKEMGLALATLK